MLWPTRTKSDNARRPRWRGIYGQAVCEEGIAPLVRLRRNDVRDDLNVAAYRFRVWTDLMGKVSD
ncbi:hypothetical protein SAMN05446935_5947 [Burkholderia sp. YR290]|jgi:hypothetical protein|nr:hypothetical protein SAMN05446935_5947 [Burkholderia sp. YR290]